MIHGLSLPYHPPHKLDHATYAWKNAKDVSALKVVSKNLMHSNLSVTDGVYSILSELDVKKKILALGKEQKVYSITESKMVILRLEQFLNELKDKNL